MQLDGLNDRVAVVTGARRGIGLGIVKALQESGARVAAFDLEAPSIDGVLGVVCDVASEDAVDAAFGTVERELGAPSIVVMNAGIYPVVNFEEMTLDLWDKTMSINVTGAFLCARRAVPAMREAGYGRLIGIGSSAGKAGGSKNVAAYAASKAAIMTLMKSLATEYAPYGITSNSLAPALIDTEMIAGTRDLLAKIPLGRFGRVEEVGALVAYLCSEPAGYITGESININGGFLID